MGSLQNISTIIGLLSGIVGLITGLIGLYGKLHKPSHEPVPVTAGHTQHADAAAPGAQVAPPPPGHRPAPGLPDLGPAVRGQYPQQGAPFPPAPRPGAGPAYAPQPALARAPSRKYHVRHPRILIGVSCAFLLFYFYVRLLPSTQTQAPNYHVSGGAIAFLVAASAVYIATVVGAAIQAIRLRRWGWLVSVIIIAPYGVACFGLFGPTTPPARH